MFIKDYRRLVLRRGDLHHVACRIRPRLQVTFFALLEGFVSGLLAVKDRDKIIGSRGRILIMWYQITGLITARLIC